MNARVVVACLLGALSVTATALAAGGGSTVSGAVAFTPGHTLSTSTDQGTGANFFKVVAGYGDLMTIGFGVPTPFQHDANKRNVGMCLLPLGTDDFTLSQAECVQNLQRIGTGTDTKLQVGYRILRAGTYTIAVGDTSCVSSQYVHPQACVNFGNGPWPPVPYDLRVILLAYTTLALQAPASAKAHGNVLVRGLLKGRNVGGARIAIQSKLKGGWKPVTTVRASATGRFSAKVPIGEAGRYLLRAVYGGDRSHQASKASVTLVAR